MPKLTDEDVQEVLATTSPEEGMPRAETHVMLLPSNVTAAAGGRAGLPARPRSAAALRNRPSAEDLEFYQSTQQDRESFVANDPVFQSAKTRDSLSLLAALKQEVARETAVLAYQRIVAERMGRDGSPISSRRIDALKKIADIELEMRKLGVDQLDVRSEQFQRVLAIWIDTIKRVAEETLTPELVDLFFNRLTSEMENWEDRAEAALR